MKAKFIDSDMTPGSSGGPWIGNSTAGYGYIFGLNSWLYDDGRGRSPWFDNKFKNLFLCFAGIVTCSNVRDIPREN